MLVKHEKNMKQELLKTFVKLKQLLYEKSFGARTEDMAFLIEERHYAALKSAREHILLAIMRFSLLYYSRSNKAGEDITSELKRFKLCGRFKKTVTFFNSQTLGLGDNGCTI